MQLLQVGESRNPQLLQIVCTHGIKTVVFRTINVMLVTEDANGHVRARDVRELDGARETLITLGIIVLQANLQLDGLEEVALLGVLGVIEELLRIKLILRTIISKLCTNLDILSNAGDRDFRHCDGLPEDFLGMRVFR
jgi:hypothetical protein